MMVVQQSLQEIFESGLGAPWQKEIPPEALVVEFLRKYMKTKIQRAAVNGLVSADLVCGVLPLF